MQRADYLALAAQGQRMPIGTDLVLREHADHEAILTDGARLGAVVAQAAARYGTPLAFPLMDLAIEKAVLTQCLDVPAAEAPTFHFKQGPTQRDLAQLEARLPDASEPRLDATVAAVAHIARETDLEPLGMTIGPLSLVVKLLSDPITAIFQAGRGKTAADAPVVAALERTFELATRVILESIRRQVAAGARAVVVCEPAASVAYISPRQLATGAPLLEQFVLRYNRRVVEALRAAGAELIFHCCGELTPDFLRAFVQLHPVLLSLGSSRTLWEDAALVPDDIVLYGNLPTKLFYSDEACPLAAVEERTRTLLTRMAASGHPFILGSECDVLSVPAAHTTISRKVRALMNVTA